jgi:phage baseplate assembly protein W
MATIKNTPLGLILPLRNGPRSGYFDQSFDSFTQIRMNIINLIRTVPGERRMQPTFGCRLWNVVFDQNDDVVPEKINNIIREDISKWIPGVTVQDVTVNYYSDDETKSTRDIYKLYIVVKFVITSVNQADVVGIYLNKGKV